MYLFLFHTIGKNPLFSEIFLKFFMAGENKKAPANASASNRQLPILPARLQASTFGLYVLNCCVRYGNRWNHIGIITGLLTYPRSKPERVQLIGQQVVCENVPRVKPEGRRRLADVDRYLRDPSSLKTIQKKLLWNILRYYRACRYSAVNVCQSFSPFRLNSWDVFACGLRRKASASHFPIGFASWTGQQVKPSTD